MRIRSKITSKMAKCLKHAGSSSLKKLERLRPMISRCLMESIPTSSWTETKRMATLWSTYLLTGWGQIRKSRTGWLSATQLQRALSRCLTPSMKRRCTNIWRRTSRTRPNNSKCRMKRLSLRKSSRASLIKASYSSRQSWRSLSSEQNNLLYCNQMSRGAAASRQNEWLMKKTIEHLIRSWQPKWLLVFARRSFLWVMNILGSAKQTSRKRRNWSECDKRQG